MVIKKLKNSTIIIILSWSKVFSVMLYSNCKLHNFKGKNAKMYECMYVRRKKERERKEERMTGMANVRSAARLMLDHLCTKNSKIELTYEKLKRMDHIGRVSRNLYNNYSFPSSKDFDISKWDELKEKCKESLFNNNVNNKYNSRNNRALTNATLNSYNHVNFEALISDTSERNLMLL